MELSFLPFVASSRAKVGIMAYHDAHPLPAITWEDITLQAEFFGEPVHPVLASSPSTTNFNANDQAKQLNIMNLNITPTTTPPHTSIGQITVGFATPSRHCMY